MVHVEGIKFGFIIMTWRRIKIKNQTNNIWREIKQTQSDKVNEFEIIPVNWESAKAERVRRQRRQGECEGSEVELAWISCELGKNREVSGGRRWKHGRPTLATDIGRWIFRVTRDWTLRPNSVANIFRREIIILFRREILMATNISDRNRSLMTSATTFQNRSLLSVTRVLLATEYVGR